MKRRSVTWKKCNGCGEEFGARDRQHVFCSSKCQDKHFNGLKKAQRDG